MENKEIRVTKPIVVGKNPKNYESDVVIKLGFNKDHDQIVKNKKVQTVTSQMAFNRFKRILPSIERDGNVKGGKFVGYSYCHELNQPQNEKQRLERRYYFDFLYKEGLFAKKKKLRVVIPENRYADLTDDFSDWLRENKNNICHDIKIKRNQNAISKVFKYGAVIALGAGFVGMAIHTINNMPEPKVEPAPAVTEQYSDQTNYTSGYNGYVEGVGNVEFDDEDYSHGRSR